MIAVFIHWLISKASYPPNSTPSCNATHMCKVFQRNTMKTTSVTEAMQHVSENYR